MLLRPKGGSLNPAPLHWISKETMEVVVFHRRRSSHLFYTLHVSSQCQTRVKLNHVHVECEIQSRRYVEASEVNPTSPLRIAVETICAMRPPPFAFGATAPLASRFCRLGSLGWSGIDVSHTQRRYRPRRKHFLLQLQIRSYLPLRYKRSSR